MPRRKVALERIENRATMQVTFSKRRKGLFKKANELAIMCSAQVLVIVFSAASKVTHYANPSVDEIIERWYTYLGTNQAPENPSGDSSTEEIERLRKDVDERDLLISQLKGENLDHLSIDQLKILSELTQNGLNRQKEKERELYIKKIAELQHPSHHPSGKNVRQTQETGAKNVVHQENTLPKSVLTTNSNCENALHDEGNQMKIVELRHTKNLIEEIGRQKKAAARAENVAYQESMSSNLIVTPNSNCEDAHHNLCLKL